MLDVKKHQLNSVYLTARYPDHEQIKPRLLSMFNDVDTESVANPYASPLGPDNISKLDWSQNEDFDRPWTKLFINTVGNSIASMVGEMGFEGIKIMQLWFQQYRQSDTHGWHGHGYNFTGVYYLELPDDAPRTQLLDPYTQQNIFTPSISEGDILLFPSYTIHRAPIVTTDSRKTIISFNFDLRQFSMDCYTSIALAEIRHAEENT